MSTNYTLINNTEKKQFEFHIEGQIAKIEYLIKEEKNRIYLIHTEVPASLGGQGIASALTLKVMQAMENSPYQLVVRCPYIIKWLERHPEWSRLIQ